ncbi:TPA: hypothetical protein N0F65_012835 [Lagenidium giganteum]|uniref:PH domain-containing protein n=1 Tax=Lagenidium giganteum TaxID=4803 RepID=A0AAV2YEX1_9STRA|nr:TPA: hypothetical protein N0F65_012835 [Lagenidium giganteum]
MTRGSDSVERDLTHGMIGLAVAVVQAPERKPIETLPSYDPTCMKEGYLQKKGQRLKGWKRRWFVCDGRTLSYFISRKDKKPNAIIPLDECTVQDGGISETWNSPRIYLTDTSSGVMYCLSAEEGEVVTEWLNVLRNAVAKVTGVDGGAAKAGASNQAERTMMKSVGSFSEDERKPTAPVARTAALKSNASATSELRSVRPSHGHGKHTKSQHLPTNISLENDISQGMDMLESLLYNRLTARNQVTFRPTGAVNGVLRSVGSSVHDGKVFARASVVLPVSSEVAAFMLTDHSKRSEWDIHFPSSTHVAAFDESTNLVHLSGGFRQLSSTKSFVSPQVAVAVSAILGLLFPGSWDDVVRNVVVAAIVGGVLNSIDFGFLCQPRDLLLLRHVRESSVMDKRAASCSDIIDNEGNGCGQSVIMILEKSVVNELKPTVSGYVRAHSGLSGWLLEPVELGRTLATYVSDVDAKGWVSPATKTAFLMERLECVAVLLEYLNQSRLCGSDLGLIGDDQESVDEDEKERLEVFDDAGHAFEGSMEFHPSVYIKGMAQLPSGGLKVVDKEFVKKQGGVVKDVIKSAGSKILEGKGLVGLSLPVRIFEPRTNLERVIDLFLFAPNYLHAAAEQTDPLERFKLVITCAFAGLHHGVGQLKPFNPILGETFQTMLNDGTEVCCEHTSHHPPISYFQLINNDFSISGHILFGFSVSMKSNAFYQASKGPIRVSFADGTVITYRLPLLQSSGLLWGDRVVELVNSMVFEDPKNNLTCELKFNPDEKKGMGGMFSTAKTPSDFVRGVIVNSDSGAELCEVTGSWLEELRFADKVMWNMKHDRSGYAIHLPDEKVLPSDSRYREDRKYLALNDMDEAQEWKVRLEVLQRADRKIRNDNRRPNHWSFKDEKQTH